MAGLTREQRAALMADSAEGAEPIDLPTPSPKASPVEPPPVAVQPATAAVPAVDALALVKMFADAMTQSSRESAMAARNPIPESYLNGGYPGKSVFSHPDGDLLHPPTKLRCPMSLSLYTDKGETIPALPIFEDACTEAERIMLNALRPGIYQVERNDGRVANWRVIQQDDDLGAPIRLNIAVPAIWLSTEHQAQMPGQPSFLRQLLVDQPAVIAEAAALKKATA
jgi:hypothetical protein